MANGTFPLWYYSPEDSHAPHDWLSAVDPKGRTTLPREMRKQLGVSEGTQLRIDVTDTGSFEIVPSVSIPVDQLYYHSPEGRARLER